MRATTATIRADSMRHTAAMAWWTAECIRAFYIGSGAAFLPIQKQWSTSALGVLPPAATGSWVKAWKKDSTRSNHRLAVVDSSQGCVGDGPPGSASKLGADLAMMMKRIVAPQAISGLSIAWRLPSVSVKAT